MEDFLNERVAEGDHSDPYDFNTGGGVLELHNGVKYFLRSIQRPGFINVL